MPFSTDKAVKNILNTYALPPLPPLTLPPLPPITDPKLRDMVFTHTSTFVIPRSFHTSMYLVEGQMGLDYEKLEHVGDAILEAIAVTMVHELYPTLRQGAAAIVRDRLVCNTTLAQISTAYGLPKRLVSNLSSRHNLRRSEKVQASIFEAYIAGVYYAYLGKVPGPAKSFTPSNMFTPPDTSAKEPDNELSSIEDAHRDAVTSLKIPCKIWLFEEAGEIDCYENQSEVDDRNITKRTDSSEVPEVEDRDDLFDIEFARLSIINIADTADNAEHESATDVDDDTIPETEINSSPDCSQESSSSDTIKPKRTRGEAFDYLFAWLFQVLEPVTQFVIESLKIEEKRLLALKSLPTTKFGIPSEWLEEDRKAIGGMTTLYQCPAISLVGKPVYKGERETINPHQESNFWRVECFAEDCHGKLWRAEAKRMTKKGASNVAAWKICVEMGLLREDE